MSAAERSARATRLLRDAGVDATVTAAGPQHEIAAVHAAAERFAEIAAQAPAIRALGFRYVALELGGRERTTD